MVLFSFTYVIQEGSQTESHFREQYYLAAAVPVTEGLDDWSKMDANSKGSAGHSLTSPGAKFLDILWQSLFL